MTESGQKKEPRIGDASGFAGGAAALGLDYCQIGAEHVLSLAHGRRKEMRSARFARVALEGAA